MKNLLFSLLLGIALSVFGEELGEEVRTIEGLDNEYAFQVGDYMTLHIVEDRSPMKTLRVRGNGELQVPYVGMMQVEGKTAREIAGMVKKELEKEYFNVATPLVEKSEREFFDNRYRYDESRIVGWQSQDLGESVTIVGGVKNQGKYEIGEEGGMTLGELIEGAGGMIYAYSGKVRIYRKMGPDEKDRRVILVKFEPDNESFLEVPLKEGDVVIFPEKIINF